MLFLKGFHLNEIEDQEQEKVTERKQEDERGATSGRDPAVTITSNSCLLYTSPSPRDGLLSRMPSSA